MWPSEYNTSSMPYKFWGSNLRKFVTNFLTMVKPKEWVKESFEQSLTQIFFVISRTAHKKVTILKCEIETSKGRPIFSGTNFLLQKAYFKSWRLQRNKIISSWMNFLIEGRSYLLVYKYPKNRRIDYVKQMKNNIFFSWNFSIKALAS